MDEKKRFDLLTSGYRIEYFQTPIIIDVFLIIINFIIPFIIPFYWVYIGFKNLFKKKTHFYKFKEVSIYKTDRKIKTERKIIGKPKVKDYYEESYKPIPRERFFYLVKCIAAFVIAYIGFRYNLFYKII
ncbi:hypothetical protein [Aureivirga marina]|uniref:hypothetical protein n=1 Tax=Aureivirga marina TaxID=1182451 RepID=UPI0018CA4269|nr:hypothetical protein [Aureivirga marina]